LERNGVGTVGVGGFAGRGTFGGFAGRGTFGGFAGGTFGAFAGGTFGALAGRGTFGMAARSPNRIAMSIVFTAHAGKRSISLRIPV